MKEDNFEYLYIVYIGRIRIDQSHDEAEKEVIWIITYSDYTGELSILKCLITHALDDYKRVDQIESIVELMLVYPRITFCLLKLLVYNFRKLKAKLHILQPRKIVNM